MYIRGVVCVRERAGNSERTCTKCAPIKGTCFSLCGLPWWLHNTTRLIINQALTICCNWFCLRNISPWLGKRLVKLVVNGPLTDLTAVEVVNCHNPLLVHHQLVFHSREKANIFKWTALVGHAWLTVWAYHWVMALSIPSPPIPRALDGHLTGCRSSPWCIWSQRAARDGAFENLSKNRELYTATF